jgi:phytoene dehydrogenase-like protein
MALASPFFRQFELAKRVELRVPAISYGHPLTRGDTGIGYRSLDAIADRFGRDGRAYRSLVRPLVEDLDALVDLTQGSLVRLPRHPLAAVGYGLRALEQGAPTWGVRFSGDAAPAMLTGVAAHVIGMHPRLSTAAAGLLLAAHAHAGGWPVPAGGSQAIADAMIADAGTHGARFDLGVHVTQLEELSGYPLAILDVSAAALLRMAGDRMPRRYQRALQALRPGNGVSKVDFALSGPVPWTHPELRATPTIHLGGTRAQIRLAEREVARGQIPSRPYVLVVQPGVVDDGRAPAGQATLWAYTHVPYGCPLDRTAAITAAIEEHAPGFRDLVLASAPVRASEFDRVSPNFAGGDFATGAVTLRQLVRRPIVSPTPWRTPIRGVYLASSATAPGPSVHGLAGWHAAMLALQSLGLPAPDLGLSRHG